MTIKEIKDMLILNGRGRMRIDIVHAEDFEDTCASYIGNFTYFEPHTVILWTYDINGMLVKTYIPMEFIENITYLGDCVDGGR